MILYYHFCIGSILKVNAVSLRKDGLPPSPSKIYIYTLMTLTLMLPNLPQRDQIIIYITLWWLIMFLFASEPNRLKRVNKFNIFMKNG